MGRTIQDRQLKVLADCEAAQRKYAEEAENETYALALTEAEVFALASLIRQAMANHGYPTPAALSVHLKAQALRGDAVTSREDEYQS